MHGMLPTGYPSRLRPSSWPRACRGEPARARAPPGAALRPAPPRGAKAKTASREWGRGRITEGPAWLRRTGGGVRSARPEHLEMR
eukprot:8663371-Pyramimonas_sp.AAC.2